MIFSNASLIESEKERNLCTKFFAGYFFNEFTAGYAKRIVQFNRYIQEVTGREDLGIQSPHISFDTHAYLNDLRHGNDTKESEEFHRRLGRYRERYLFPDGQTAEEN